MSDVRITCIRLAGELRSHEHITEVGNASGAWPREQVVIWIDNDIHTFYVQDDSGKRADVKVIREAGKLPYLRTQSDGRWSDNLLALRDCWQ
jgi:hypothetical protein